MSLSKKQTDFLKILGNCCGNITEACKKSKVPRRTVYNWMESTEFKEAVEDVNEEELDFTESQLKKLIKGVVLPEDKVFLHQGEVIVHKGKKHYPPDNTSIIFHLKTKGKKRGWIERQELDLSGKVDTSVVVYLPDNQR